MISDGLQNTREQLTFQLGRKLTRQEKDGLAMLGMGKKMIMGHLEIERLDGTLALFNIKRRVDII